MTPLDRDELRRRTQQIAQLSEDPTKSVDTTGAIRDARDFGRAVAQLLRFPFLVVQLNLRRRMAHPFCQRLFHFSFPCSVAGGRTRRSIGPSP